MKEGGGEGGEETEEKGVIGGLRLGVAVMLRRV